MMTLTYQRENVLQAVWNVLAGVYDERERADVTKVEVTFTPHGAAIVMTPDYRYIIAADLRSPEEQAADMAMVRALPDA